VKIKYYFTLILLSLTGSVVAQTACPTGVAAGSAQCGPSPISHTVGPSQPVEPQIRYVPTGKWTSKWGAIMVDSIVGDIGATDDELSEDAARRTALERCEKHGAKNCEVTLVYSNQCGVIAWPSVTNAKVVSQASKTIEAASQAALSECANISGAACRIVHSNCSMPVFEKF
jgi:uncharacterized protein DUF4189